MVANVYVRASNRSHFSTNHFTATLASITYVTGPDPHESGSSSPSADVSA